MIPIDISELHIPKKWQEKARRATEKLRDIPEHERADFIERHSRIWQELKTALERVSSDKCWYCETKNIRADYHVDHHRPKNKVRNDDGTEEPGYWWLAFDHGNLRLACSYCNCLHTGNDGIIRGKSDRFPLSAGSRRAVSPESNIIDEMPLLLDPTSYTDPSLLWFLDDGTECPKHRETDGLLYQRAHVTIDILNLNDFRIVEARKELWSRCKSLIEQGDRAFDQYKNGSPAGKSAFDITVQEIWQLTKSCAEFSATARACFRGSSKPWVREIVQ